MKPAIFIVAILAVVGVIFVGPRFTSAAAPDFTLEGRGQTVSLSQLRGRVVVIDFWASWCPPCRAAIPAIQRISEEYREHNVAVLGINVNDRTDPYEFMASVGASYTVLVDNGSVARAYRVKGIPTLIVVDKAGKIRYRESGFGGRTETEMREAINAALAE